MEVNQKEKTVKKLQVSKRCGYIAYPVDYTDHQGHDPGAHLKEGDEVEGSIITRKVIPYLSTDGELCNKCTVPVFCSKDDPIEFEIALEAAFNRAGRILEDGQLKYGSVEKKPKERSIVPETCLIVKTLKT